MLCEHCNGPGNDDVPTAKCCWTRAMEIERFKQRVKRKYIIEVVFDLIVSVTSVVTDLMSLFFYLYKKKFPFAILTLIPVLLPTFVFTNVYMVDEHSKRSRPVSRVISINRGAPPEGKAPRETSRGKVVETQPGPGPGPSSADSEETDSSIRSFPLEESRCHKCLFHCSICRMGLDNWRNCVSGCVLCMCNRDHKIRRAGAKLMKNSMQRMFKYGFGTFVLRFIAWAWYIKALIYGVKAYREPKRFMKIEPPNNHWSYELLVRLDFLQAALENAPQCVVQLYALITQPDEDVPLGVLTLIFSFVDFIRVSVSVHWDMDKGPVIAPNGCYNTWIWKSVNTSSWILIYSARAAALAMICATVTLNITGPLATIPAGILVVHVLLFAKLLSKAEYGVAAQKVFIAVFISIFFLPELDSTFIPALIQFYYAAIIIQNAFFILPWEGFDKELCLSRQGFVDKQKYGTTPPPRNDTWANFTTGPTLPTSFTFPSTAVTIPKIGRAMGIFNDYAITPEIVITTEEPVVDTGCLIDPVIITLAVPTLTIIGVVFRLASSQKMVNFKRSIPSNSKKAKNKMETSIANLFSKKWTQMSVSQMYAAFIRMLKKEVIIVEKSAEEEAAELKISELMSSHPSRMKRVSFLAVRLQADFLASQTFIRESFSLMTRTSSRTTRSHEINMGFGDDEPPPEYNSDSELTFRNNVKKRPRIPRSRNVSESVSVNDLAVESPSPPPPDVSFVQIELPSGPQFVETMWI